MSEARFCTGMPVSTFRPEPCNRRVAHAPENGGRQAQAPPVVSERPPEWRNFWGAPNAKIPKKIFQKSFRIYSKGNVKGKDFPNQSDRSGGGELQKCNGPKTTRFLPLKLKIAWLLRKRYHKTATKT